MRKFFFIFAFILVGQSFAFAQALKPLANGGYPTSATDVEANGYMPKTDAVSADISSSSDNSFSIKTGSNQRVMPWAKMARFEGNLFSEVDNSGNWVIPTTVVVVLQPNSVMELYYLKGGESSMEIDRTIAIAPKGAKFGDLKKSAKDHAESIDFNGLNGKLKAANAARQEKLAAEKAAAEAAAAKAAEERRIAEEAKRAADKAAYEERKAKEAAEQAAQNKAYADRTAAISKADFCTGITKYTGMSKSRFKAVKGKILPADDLYSDSDTTFAASEVLNLFDFGIVQTRHKSANNATDLLFYMELWSVNDVHSHYDLLLARLKTCMTESKGWHAIDHDGSFTWYNDKVWVRLHKRFNSYDDNVPDNTLELEISPK